jgi:hypothetical protein
VRPTRTRARNTAPDASATGSRQDDPGSNPVRSALDIARERWGTPIGPVTVEPDGTWHVADTPAPVRNALDAWRIWSEPAPPMAAIWADLLDGAQKQGAYGWGWLIPYWAFGVVAFPTACLARLLLDSSARPGRYAALLLAVALFIAGLDVAGVI